MLRSNGEPYLLMFLWRLAFNRLRRLCLDIFLLRHFFSEPMIFLHFYSSRIVHNNQSVLC